MKVYNEKDAMQFFLKNSCGTVECIHSDGNSKECGCYPEAVEFFKLKEKSDD